MSSTALFDAPGPRARLRHRILTIAGVLIALGLLYVVYRRMDDKGQLTGALWEPFLTGEAWTQYLVPGLIGTFKAAVLSIVFAGVLGLILGLGRLSENGPIRWVASVIVEFFRAVPVLIMMIFAFGVYSANGIFRDDLNPLAAVVTALTLYNGAVIAELVRSGVFGLPKGQREAGLSVGLTPSKTLRTILLPQALTAMLPALVGQLVVVLKDSALGTVITYGELLDWSKALGSNYANTVPAYIVAAILFIGINFSLTLLARKLEQRLSHRGRSTLPANPAGALPLPAGGGTTTGMASDLTVTDTRHPGGGPPAL